MDEEKTEGFGYFASGQEQRQKERGRRVFEELISRIKTPSILEHAKKLEAEGKQDELAEFLKPIAQKDEYSDLPESVRTEILTTLDHDKKDFKDLGQGTGKDFFYYGINDEDGGEVLITSKARLLVGREKIEGHGIDYMANWTIKECLYSDSALAPRDWLAYFGKSRQKHTAKDLFDRVEALNKRYIWHKDDRENKLFACALTASYAYSLFDKFPRINLCGASNSGKTTQANMYQALGHNAFNATDATLAVYNRAKNCGVGIIVLNNFDNIKNEEKLAEFKNDYETSYERGTWHRVTDSRAIETGPKFRPYVIDNIDGVDAWSEASVNRTIKTIMDTKPPGCKLSDLNGAAMRSHEFRELKRDLCFFILDNWQEIKAAYDETKAKTPLSNRHADTWAPVLTIAKMAGEDVYNSLLVLAAEKIEAQGQAKDTSRDWRYWALLYACENVSPDGIAEVPVKEAAKKMLAEEMGINDDSREYPGKLRWVAREMGRALRNMPNVFKQGSKRHGSVRWDSNADALKEHLIKRGEAELLTILQDRQKSLKEGGSLCAI